MCNGLNRHQRIRKHSEFQRLQGPQAPSRRLTTSHLIVLCLDNELGTSRLGLAVSRKVGNAVVRNRVKRLLREAFRAVRPRFTRTIDVVLIAKPQAVELSLAQVQAQLAGLLPRLNDTRNDTRGRPLGPPRDGDHRAGPRPRR